MKIQEIYVIKCEMTLNSSVRLKIFYDKTNNCTKNFINFKKEIEIIVNVPCSIYAISYHNNYLHISTYNFPPAQYS